ncbi:MAG TPA: PfkB family carbohydrate kinase [Acidimicrobiia bacterium]
MKVAVFAPNLALTVTVESGESDAPEMHLHPGGQAFWVARMLSHLGVTPMLCGPVGGETGLALTALIRLWEVEFYPVESSDDSPAIVQDRRSGERVVIAETDGHSLDRHTLDNAYSLFLELALEAGVAVITGQRSAVVPLEAYRRLGHDLSSTEVRVVADLHGPELDAFLEGGRIDILKVSDEDLAEDGTLLDDSDRAAMAAIEDLNRRGAVEVVLSRADRPTIAKLGGDIYHATTPRLEPADFRGAGDSMTAGLVAGLVRNLEPTDLLRLACGAGAANVTRHGLGSGSEELIGRLAEKVLVSVAAPIAG